ncbi:MAG TPA: Gfo/Idh/MocA family oxidoreductase [Chthonomonadales bacterium]|nr:Gfo/Idh/MocA family oxidoreductase [Chthonomonadales bacterium]
MGEQAVEALQVAVVGCGGSRQAFGPALPTVAGVRLAAMVDSDTAAARTWTRGTRGAAIHHELDGLLAGRPVDAALLFTPLPEREAQLRRLLESGIHVLCEVPPVLGLSVWRGMAALAAEAGVHLVPALRRRHDPVFLRVAELLEAGAIGRPERVRCDWSFLTEYAEHRSCVRSWPGALLHMAIVTVDLAGWWLGDAATVSADIDAEGRRQQDIANMIFHHEHGVSIHHLARTTRRNPVEHYTITGDEGHIEAAYGAGWSHLAAEPFRATLHRRGAAPEDVTPPRAERPAPASRVDVAAAGLLEAFSASVRSGAPPRGPDHFGRALEALVGAYLSSASRAKVTLPLPSSPNVDAALPLLVSSAAEAPPHHAPRAATA